MASIASGVISVETTGTSASSSSHANNNGGVSLPPIARPGSTGDNPCRRCHFRNEQFYNFCIKCGNSLGNNNKSSKKTKQKIFGDAHQNKPTLPFSQSASSLSWKEQSVANIQSDYSVNVHGGGGNSNSSRTKSKSKPTNGNKSKMKQLNNSKNSFSLNSTSSKTMNNNIQPLQPPPSTLENHPEGMAEKSLNATLSAASVLTTSTMGSSDDGNQYSDISSLDLPPPVLKALTTKVEPDRNELQRQRVELQEKLLKASMLEISNAELLERMYSKLSLFSEMQRLPRTDSAMSVESIDSLPSHLLTASDSGNSNNANRPKKLKSQRSMVPSSSMRKNNHNQSHNQSFLSIGSVASVSSIASTVHPLQGSSFYGANNPVIGSGGSSFSLKPQLERKPSKYARNQSNYLSQFESVVSMREKILEEKKVSAGILGTGSVFISDTVDKVTPSRASSRLSMPISEEPEEGKAWLWGDCLGKSTGAELATNQSSEDQISAKGKGSESPVSMRRTLHSSPSVMRLSTIMSRSNSSILNDPEIMNQSQKSLLSSRSDKVMNSSSKGLTSNNSFFWGSLLSGQSEKDQQQANDILEALDIGRNKEPYRHKSPDNANSIPHSFDETEEQDVTEESPVKSRAGDIKDNGKENESFDETEEVEEALDDHIVETQDRIEKSIEKPLSSQSSSRSNKKKPKKEKLPDIPSKPLVSASKDVPASVKKKYQSAIEAVNDLVINKRYKSNMMPTDGSDIEDDEEIDEESDTREVQDDYDENGSNTTQKQILVVDEDDRSMKEIEEDMVMHNAKLEHHDHYLLLDLSKRYLDFEDERRTQARMNTLHRLEQEMNRTPRSRSRSPLRSKSRPYSSSSRKSEEGDEDYDPDELFQSPFVLSESPYLAMDMLPTEDDEDDNANTDRVEEERRRDVDEEIYLIQEERDRLEELRKANTNSIRGLVDEMQDEDGNGDDEDDFYYADQVEGDEDGDALLQPVFDREFDRDLYAMDNEQIEYDQEKRELEQLQEEQSFEDLTASFDSQMLEHDKRATKRAKTLSVMENSGASSASTMKRNQRMMKNLNSVLAQTLKPMTASASVSISVDGKETLEMTQESNDGNATSNINFNSNLTVGKYYIVSYERMKKSIDNIYVDFRVDINTLYDDEIDEFRNHYDRARVAIMLAQEVNQQVLNEMKLFHERASLQRSTIAFNISECLVKATTMDRFFREQYEQEREVYLKTYVPAFKKQTKKIDLVSDEMKEIQERGNLAMQQIGNQIKELQVAEQQILRALKQEEFAINETIEHWRPKHAKRLTELAIAIGRAEGWLKSRKGIIM